MWTKNQQRVIDYKNGDLLVAAAAGSGKTAVLVERIIQKILKKETDIDKLLVVTFTNLAASEMRERINDALSKELDKNPENTHLQNQMVLLSKANINTIHSFCLDVIKSNFHKVNINPSFKIADTHENKILKQESIEEVFEKFYEKGQKNFLNLVNCYANKKGDDNLQEIIINIYDFCMSSPNPIKWLKDSSEMFNIDDDFKFEESLWGKIIIDSILENLCYYKESMENHLKDLEKISLDENTNSVINYTTKYKTDYNSLSLLYESLKNDWNSFCKKLKNYSFESYKGNSKKSEKFASVHKECEITRNEHKKYIEGLREKYLKTTEDIKYEFNYLYDILKILSDIIIEVHKVFSNKKREKNVLDFNDIEHFALQILIDENNNPTEIAKELQNKYHEIFIDEYQDSNYVQELILKTISNEKFKNRFMVGDVKQSIYRFRQAKPEIFLEKYEKYSTEESDETKIMLHQNFRSRKEVIDFCNYIFESVMCKKVGEIDYNENEKLNLGASFKENENPEFLTNNETEILVISSKEKNTEEDDDEEDLTKAQLEARLIAQKIIELTTQNKDGKYFSVFDKKLNNYRKTEYKDIVILLRSTKNVSDVFQKELNNYDIPVFVESDSGYFESLEIKTIMSLLKVIDNPYQDIFLLSVLKSPIFDFSSDDLIELKLINENSKNFYDLLKCYIINGENKNLVKKCENVINKLKIYKEKAMYMSTDEFLWYLYTDTGYYYYVGGINLGNQRQANLKILFERARQFEENSFKGIFNFINLIKKLQKTDTDLGSAKIYGENANVVRIMTIHKSKGLEFPIVFCSNLDKKFNDMDLKKTFLYHHNLGYGPDFVDYENKFKMTSIAKEALKIKIKEESLSEEMRVLYVALTRAKEKLILTGTLNKTKKYGLFDKYLLNSFTNQKVNKNKIASVNSYMDWIMLSILKDNILLDDFNYQNIKLNNKTNAKFKLINEENLNFSKQNTEKKNILKEIDVKKEYTNYFDKISESLNYVYPHQKLTKISSSISVSEIKKIQSEEDEYSFKIFDEAKFNIKKPLFVSKIKSNISPTEKGKMIHLVMELININKTNSADEIKSQIDEFVNKNIITKEQSKVIDANKILKFFESELGQRLKNSDFVKKEQSIYSRINIKDVYLDEEFLEDETLMLRGIIDVYFEEDEEIVLIDYKTDYVEDIFDIKKKYEKQVDLYQKSLEKLTGKKVKEKYLYLFNIDEALKM